MDKIIQMRDDDYFGLCPKCHRKGIMRHSDRKTHWYVCEEHKLKWGPDQVFSFPYTDDDGPFSWEKGDELLKRNRFILAGYRTVEPFSWPRPTPSDGAADDATRRQDCLR
jgi:hypothetical protein